jgi:probable F420-dependent oxidoreductase
MLSMRIGVVFPQIELGHDTGQVRAYAEGVDGLGFDHFLAYDHVIGADPTVHDWDFMPYDVHTTFREPLVLFGYVAGFTSLELVSGIVILPQRQTALVAKQAAEVDLLTGGRFRLGVGVGWNRLEYDALGKDFTDRGRRVDEQVAFLRRLWTEPSLTFEGAYERLVGGGISPLPVQRPIPIWFGAASPPAYRRVGRIGDGWFPMMQPDGRLDEALAFVAEGAAAAGRDAASIGMEGRVGLRNHTPDEVLQRIDAWRARGATHVTIDTMRAGLVTADDHLQVLGELAASLSLARRG